MSSNNRQEKQEKQWDRLDSIIQRKFTASNMSNAKWVKLFKRASSFYPDIRTIDFKLVYSDEIKRTEIEEHQEHVDKYWFLEPPIYKEIEWIEFPFSENQEISNFEESINLLGKYPVLHSSTGLRIVAYE